MTPEVKPSNTGTFKTTNIIASVTLIVGVMAIVASALYASTILAIIGLGLTFWGTILLYITPSRHVPLGLLNATATSTLVNIEKIMVESNLDGRAIYLPPKYLKDFESSLIFVPSKAEQPLPTPEEIEEERLYSKNPEGIFLTPPGLTLSKLFEKELGTSFTKTDFNYFKDELPKLFVEDMEIAADTEIRAEKDTITVEITNHILREVCQETRKLEKTHRLVGCPLTSSIACALAKTTGKPITIENEEQSQDGKTTKIQYRIIEE